MYFPKSLNRWIITWFGCGYFPKAPGTAGSVGALPVCWFAAAYLPFYLRVVLAIGVTAIAILSSAQDQVTANNRDPGYIVIDEVAGMLWTTLPITAAWLPMLIAFGLFRLLDIFKPFPANIFDRRSKTSTSTFRRGACIVLDDVLAGMYGALILSGLIAYGALPQSWQ